MSRLDEIKARCKTATPEPWEWWQRPILPPILVSPAHDICIVMDAEGGTLRFAKREPGKDGLLHKIETMSDYDKRDSEIVIIDNPDAQFIKHSRSDVNWLVRKVESLERQIRGNL